MHRKKLLFALMIFILTVGTLYAGDIARFVNLGFSNNSKYFMFGQYGIEEETSKPYGDIFIVSIPKNSFVKSGVKHFKAKKSANPGDTGEGALFNLLEEIIKEKKHFKIDHLNTGRILFLLLNGEKPKEKIEFRDFLSGKSYTIHMVQSTFGKGPNISSSFYIDVDILSKKTGKKEHYEVGLPNYRRRGVKSYKIRKIIITPDQKSLIFVIEKEETAKSGFNIRYMVEALNIN